ncbi:MAG: RNA-directed DNA polymerase [Chloroflexi bacterium]|nr:RNA-directed DNA polymerase [Chloroflexota bacterium]
MNPLPLLVSLPREPESIDVLAGELDLTPDERSLAVSLYSRGLPPLVHRKCLPYMFGVSPRLIAAMQKRAEHYYRRFTINKQGGGTRAIVAPRRFLKLIQTWINGHICSKERMPECVMGFVRGRSIFDNGRAHCKNKNVMVVDVKDFFPSVTLQQVEAVFASFGFPEEICRQLGGLCTLDGGLPQGAPTSPALANLVFLSVDERLSRQAAEWNCTYTRYADDIVFSGARHFISEDVACLREILRQGGFTINDRKTRIVGQGGRQTVTGLVVNGKALPPRSKRRRWRAMFHRAANHPHEFFDRARSLAGIAAFVNQYSSERATEYGRIAQEVREKSQHR